MDAITRSYYLEIIDALQAQGPDEPVTTDRIEEFATMRWGTTVRDLENSRKDALQTINAIDLDPQTRIHVAVKTGEYYNEQRERFEKHYFEAVSEVYRTNGLPEPSHNFQVPTEKANTHSAPVFRRPWERDNSYFGRHAEYLRGTHVPALRQLSERQQGQYKPLAKFRSGRERLPQPGEERVDKPTHRKKAKTLAPSLQHIPPLGFTLRHRRNPENELTRAKRKVARAQNETWEQLCARKSREKPSQAQPTHIIDPSPKQTTDHEWERSWER